MSLAANARRRFRIPRPVLIGGGIVLVFLAIFAACQMRPKPPAEPYRFGAVERGDVTRAVSASGSLQALITVDVGSQISGLVTRVLADFNDNVRAGQTLAVIDPQTFQSRVAQSLADINAGEAQVRQAQATLANAEADFARKKTLVDQGISSPAVLDQATAALGVARANVAAARARVGQSQATLRIQRADLVRTTIVSPINGVVVDRKVEPGQTVAASFQAPVLFTIAQDLSKVEVRISVDEADVGQVREGQAVRFTVDAFPDDAFAGVVTQVRKQPTTTQNVVTYTVIAEADNPARMLLPGMTANADIIIDVRRNVLKIPATALRWTPPPPPRRGPDNDDAKPATPPPTRAAPSADGMRPGTVYVVRDDAPKAIAVRVGATDGTVVEVVSRELKAGDQVILGGGPKAGARGFGGGPPPSVRARLGE